MLELIPLHDNQWELGDNYTRDGVTVPKGYITDLASIPRILWWLYPASNGDYAGACVVHDYLYTIKFPRKSADRALRKALKEDGNNRITVFLFYSSVRIFGWSKYL